MNGIGRLTLGGLMIAAAATAQQPTAHKWAIVLHGGAGVIERATMSAEAENAYRASMAKATEAGAQVLDKGGHNWSVWGEMAAPAFDWLTSHQPR